MSQHIIKSVLNPENIRYCAVDGFYDSGLLVFAFGQYETLGDGECQHTPPYRIGRDRMADFCLSVAQYLLENPEASIYGHWIGLTTVGQDAYDFLRKIKYSETKRQFYSLQLRKVTSNEEKRHDKRFAEVPTWADGSVKSAWELFWFGRETRGCLLERYSIFESFRQLAGGSFYQQDECETWLRDIPLDFGQAWRAMRSAYDAREAREWAGRLIESAKSNSTRKMEVQAAA